MVTAFYKERRIRMNLIPVLNLGLVEALNRTKLSMLSRSKITDDNGNVTGYRAIILVTEDNNRYVKRDGEVVEGPNSLETFRIQVNSANMPNGTGMIPDVQLVHPTIVSNYATSQIGSTFAQIHVTIVCDNVQISNKGSLHQSPLKKDGGQ